MNRPGAHQLVDGVYRRWLVIYFCEQMGRGLAVGSLLALGLIPIAIWQHLPTTAILVFAELFGFFLGIILGFYRQPDRYSAAVETDRQLRLDDLLTSAIFPPKQSGDDFRTIVQSLADARCAMHSPSEVLLRRIGIRSWSGIALAMSAAATLVVIPLQASRSQAVDANLAALSEKPVDVASVSNVAPGLLSVFNNPTSDDGFNKSMSTETASADPTKESETHPMPAARSDAGAAGTGGGSASSHVLPQQPAASKQSTGRPSDRTGVAATGGDSAAGHWDRHDDRTSTAAGNTAKPAQPIPGWSGKESATPDVANTTTPDRIPPEDRDLVRDFFNN